MARIGYLALLCAEPAALAGFYGHCFGMTEIGRTARALKEITKCDKLNIAALGNLVPQLHVHVIARRASDAAWPRPVWGIMPPLAHDAEEVQNFISALRRKIWLG